MTEGCTVISMEAKRRQRAVQSGTNLVQAGREISIDSLLSLNIANWIAANYKSISMVTPDEEDQNLRAALYMAKARYFYYQGHTKYAAQMLRSVSRSTTCPDLRGLALVCEANSWFSAGDFARAAELAGELQELAGQADQSVTICLHLLQGNLEIATGGSIQTAHMHFRRIFAAERGMFSVGLQRALGMVHTGTPAAPGSGPLDAQVRKFRDLLDNFIESAAGRYFAGIVVSLT